MSTSNNWLDRLRSTNGIPISDHTDLEHFISNYPNPKSPNVSGGQTTPFHRDTDIPMPTRIRNVLSSLFMMGGGGDSSSSCCDGEKRRRKQSSPKQYPGSAHKKGKKKMSSQLRDDDLSGFSRTEVTVIDTSGAMWKSDKVLFRKKNVWKVRESKGVKKLVWKKRKAAGEEKQEAAGGAECRRRHGSYD